MALACQLARHSHRLCTACASHLPWHLARAWRGHGVGVAYRHGRPAIVQVAAVRCAPPRRLRAFLGAPSAALAVAHPEAAEALRAHAGLGLDPAAAGVLRVLPAALLHAPAGAGKHPNR